MPSLEDIQRDPLALAKWVDYSTYDAEATWLLRAKLEGFLRARPWVTSPSSTGVAGVSGTGGDMTMFDFYQRYLLPFAECLTDMERAGITVDARDHLPKAEQLALADREQGASPSSCQWRGRVVTGRTACPPIHTAHVRCCCCYCCCHVQASERFWSGRSGSAPTRRS